MTFSCTEQIIYQTTLPPFSRTLTIMNGSMHCEKTSTPKNVRVIVIQGGGGGRGYVMVFSLWQDTLDEYHQECNISRRYHLRQPLLEDAHQHYL